jgi:NAD(P)H-dependent nitrite reductase small subunit
MPDYIPVARLSDLPPGSCKAVEVSGRTIALFNVDGAVYALENVCLHRGGPLGEGRLEGEVVTCPWHQWQYNVRSGEMCGNPAVKVPTYPVRVEGGTVKVAI